MQTHLRRPNTKAAVFKVPRPYVKEIHLLILKYLSEGRNLLDSFWGWRHWWVPFLHSTAILLALALVGTI